MSASPGRIRPRLSRTFSWGRWPEYRRFLHSALERGYRIVPLEEWVREPGDDRAPVLVLRHDVDQNPRSALVMAEIEQDLGVSSTWYFRWRTAHPIVIRTLREAGFTVGLHYETLTRRALERSLSGTPSQAVIEESRRVLRDEISAFDRAFGPIRSVVPHGDSRLPGVRNSVLLRGEDCSAYGIEFDGNEAMRGRGLAHWLTDRAAPEGGWKDGLDPTELFAAGASPILCVAHPNNWSSGPSLWVDRALSAVLPAPASDRGRPSRPIRTGSDAPAEAGGGGFAPITTSLRRSVLAFYERRGEALLSEPGGINTLETNAGFVERRGRPLLEILSKHGGLGSIAGLRVLDLGCGFGALSLFFAAQGALVTGIDPNRKRLSVGRAVAREHGVSAEFRPGRMQALDLPDRSFDVVVQNNSLCYVVPRDEREVALSETWRVLRPGGILILRNPNRWSPLDQFTRLPLLPLLPPGQAVRVAKLLGRTRSLVRLTSPLETRRELRAAGFTAIEHVSSPASRWPGFMKPVARYQHLIAERPHPHAIVER